MALGENLKFFLPPDALENAGLLAQEIGEKIGGMRIGIRGGMATVVLLSSLGSSSSAIAGVEWFMAPLPPVPPTLGDKLIERMNAPFPKYPSPINTLPAIPPPVAPPVVSPPPPVVRPVVTAPAASAVVVPTFTTVLETAASPEIAIPVAVGIPVAVAAGVATHNLADSTLRIQENIMRAPGGATMIPPGSIVEQ